jgi:hypothetical protein
LIVPGGELCNDPGVSEDRAEIERWFESERARSCGRKRRYASEREALDAAYLIRMQGGEELSAYRCRFCGRWHLGHSLPDRGP